MFGSPAFRIVCGVLPLASLLAATASAERVLVASNAIWEVDTVAGSARELASLGLFVKDLAVDAAGTTGWAATSDGILEIDLATGGTVRNLGEAPARSVELAEAVGKVYGMFTRGSETPPEIRAFSLADGRQVGSSALPAGTKEISWDGADDTVLGLGHGTRSLRVHDPVTFGERRVVTLPRPVATPGTSSLGHEILVHESSGTILVPEIGAEGGLWVIRPGRDAAWVAFGHEAHVRGGAISADGRFVFLSALDHVSKVDLELGREVAWVGLDLVHQRIALSEDGHSLFLTVPVTGEGGALSVLSADSLLPVGRIPVPEISPFVLAVVPE